MDNISNLSSNLPPTKPITDQSIKDIDSELTHEFREAANAVAGLYKLSLQKKNIIKHQGYLDCLNDLLNVIKNEGDIENWALSKRMELDGNATVAVAPATTTSNTSTDTPSDQQQQHQQQQYQQSHQPQEDLRLIPQNAQFTVSHQITHKFRPGMPLLSVDYATNKQNQIKRNQSQSFLSQLGNKEQLPVYDMSNYMGNNNQEDEDTNLILSGHATSVKRSLEDSDVDKRQKLNQ